MRVVAVGLAIMAFTALPGPANAQGQIELSQTCATLTGCLPGDTPGFPITIASPLPASSLRLTSDLVVGAANSTAIVVTVLPDHVPVEIDLAGFAVLGPNTCSGMPVVCTATGTGRGIEIAAGSVSVRNGRIQGFASSGIEVLGGSAPSLEKLVVRENGGGAIVADGNARIEGCTIERNGGGIRAGSISTFGGRVVDNDVRNNGSGATLESTGIQVGDGALVADNRVRDGSNFGISTGIGAVVRGNVVQGHASVGVSAGSRSIVEGNVVRSNASRGIVSPSYANITGNAVSLNGNVGISAGDGSIIEANQSSDNGGDGIVATGGSLVRRNTVQDNTGVGLALSADTGYSDNVIVGNTAGTVTGGIEIGPNLCAGAIGCP